MTFEPSKLTIPERFEHLYALVSSPRFLQKQGLNNEVPFFICPFSPDEALDMERTVRQLIRKLEQNGVNVLEINLYDLCIELLQARGIWERILEIEETTPKARLKELLQSVLDPEKHLAPAIAAKMRARREDSRAFDVMFITGVGEVFPYVRSHNILNNLQSTAKEQPTVMFFPGTYTQSAESGASLKLFALLHDDNYYRAFNIYHVGI